MGLSPETPPRHPGGGGSPEPLLITTGHPGPKGPHNSQHICPLDSCCPSPGPTPYGPQPGHTGCVCGHPRADHGDPESPGCPPHIYQDPRLSMAPAWPWLPWGHCPHPQFPVCWRYQGRTLTGSPAGKSLARPDSHRPEHKKPPSLSLSLPGRCTPWWPRSTAHSLPAAHQLGAGLGREAAAAWLGQEQVCRGGLGWRGYWALSPNL